MQSSLGIFFALGALLSWGFEDFFIQRTVRAIGTWKALFFICATGGVILLPFVYQRLPDILSAPGLVSMLLVATTAALAMGLFDFEAFRRGKLAIVEPIISFELPLTIGFVVFLRHEQLGPIQLLLTFVVFCGILLSITIQESHLHYHKRIFEKGVLLAFGAAIASALSNFLIGSSSQDIDPLVTIWFIHTLVALVSAGVLLARGDFAALLSDFRRQYAVIVPEVVFDNLGWVCFAVGASLIPIAITTTISESYVALAVLLGIFITKEKLQRHQFVGIVLAVCGVILLSLVTIP